MVWHIWKLLNAILGFLKLVISALKTLALLTVDFLLMLANL